MTTPHNLWKMYLAEEGENVEALYGIDNDEWRRRWKAEHTVSSSLKLSFTFKQPEARLLDFHPCDVASGLCSRRFRSVVEPLQSRDDRVTWVPSAVFGADATPLAEYYVMLVEPVDNILHHSSRYRSLWKRDLLHLDVPVIDVNKINNHAVFYYEWSPGSAIVVEPVAAAVRAACLTGIELGSIRTA